MFYVICYDIPDDKRRKKIADLLEGYGQRVQYSVFECALKRKKYQLLQSKLKKIVDLQQDNLRFYSISSHTYSQIEVWGNSNPVTSPPKAVII